MNKIINPHTDGVVLPILHLNGYKIANPTIFARIPEEELIKYFEGCGYKVYIVESNSTSKIHELMAKTLDKCISDIKSIK
jgi:xylulose-5-phosphate/fructose-6-phosphate phosphoketolase